MIQMHLLNIKIHWMMFMRILMIIIPVEKKILIVFDDMIANIMTNKKISIHNKRIIY